MKNSPVHWSHRSAAIVLMVLQPLIGWPMYTLAAETSAAQGNPSPVRSVNQPSPEKVQPLLEPQPTVTVNRTVPEVEGPAGFQLSDKPSDEEITQCGLFSEPLVPMTSVSDAQENQDLSTVLHLYANRKDADDVSALTTFCKQHPDSRWRVAVLYNLAHIYYFQGYYSKALANWDEAWHGAKAASDVTAVALANQTLAQLARMNARIGRTDRLEELLKESASRQIAGSAAQVLANLKDALVLMKIDPGHSFLCGPLALAEIRRSQHISDTGDHNIAAAQSTYKGCSFNQVANLAAAAGMKYQIARRDPGAAIITPAVVHWKLGHFAALVKEDHGKYLSKDLTFKNNLWLTRAAIDEEASGYFLVPQGLLPTGWHTVAAGEVADVWGCGGTDGYDPGGETPFDPGCGCGGGDGLGMAHYDVKAQPASLTVFDTPVGYRPPVGPGVFFTARYQQRADGQPANFTFSNLGPSWFHDWMAYVVDDPTNPGADVKLFTPGGGYLNFTGYDSTSKTYALELVSNTTLVIASATTYQWFFPDGSMDVFSVANNVNGPGRQVFLTEVIDAQGNKLTLNYDKKFRLVGVTDTIGQVTTLSYQLSGDPYKITKVTDPFGRSATFAYTKVNGTYMLTADTDVSGITSKYGYQEGNLHELTTPYGRTTFIFAQNAGGGIGRAVDIFDPEGGHQRVENNQGVFYEFSDSLIPAGMNLFNQYLNYRDTFFWDQHAMEVGGYDYHQATRVYHFQHTPDMLETGRLVEAVGRPLESRIWMNYPGQTEPNGSGFEAGVTVGKPSLVGRVVDTNGTTQLSQYSYNGLGNVTTAVDPAGRTTQYTYAPNGIDITQVQHYNGSSYDTVRTAVYNGQHLPTQVTDAAGQVTKFTYNAFGEVATVTDPKNETTTYTYNATGYLQKITDALGGTRARYTHDSFGRVHTYTDVNGFTRTYSYDNLNRLTEIKYPDGTSDNYSYQATSLVKWEDRLQHVTNYKYNSLQQLVEVTDPKGHDTQYSYCGCGVLTEIIDSNGSSTTFVRDGEDRLSQKIYPDKSVVSVSYDFGGRLSSMLDAKQQTTTYQYTVDDRLDQVTYASPTPGVSFTFDAYGRVASMIDGIGTTQYGYVPAGQQGALRLASEARPAGYGTVTYQYDQLGRVVTESIDNNDFRNFTYDAIGRVTNQANALGAFAYQFVGPSNRLQSLAEPNGQNFSYGYYPSNNDFRLEQIQQTSGSTKVTDNYSYDAVGNIVSWSQQNPIDGTGTWTLSYDADNQIQKLVSKVSSTSSGLDLGQSTFQYDPGVNLTQFTTNSPLTSLSSAAYQVNNLNQVTAITGTNYSGSVSYDANGNPTDSIGVPSANPNTVTGERTYTWDGANRLIQITYNTGTGNSTSLSYDGFGRLARIVEAVNGATQSDARFVWVGNGIAEQRNSQGGIVREYFGQGFTQASTAYYYGKDHLGSIRNLTDASGAIQTQIDYGLFGEVTSLAGGTQPDFGYTGLFYHQRSGLYLAKYRAYDPGLKRWLNRDPIRELGGINLYTYVANAPATWVDRNGLQSNASGPGTPSTGGHGGYCVNKNLPLAPFPSNAGSLPVTPGANGPIPLPGTGNTPGTGTDPGTGNTPGTGNNPGTGTDPGTGNTPGTGNNPGTGTDPGTGNTPGTGTDPGTGNNPGTGSNPGTGTDPGTGNQEPPFLKMPPGTGTDPGTGTGEPPFLKMPPGTGTYPWLNQ